VRPSRRPIMAAMIDVIIIVGGVWRCSWRINVQET
jgi:hypothetical protein